MNQIALRQTRTASATSRLSHLGERVLPEGVGLRGTLTPGFLSFQRLLKYDFRPMRS